MEHLVSIGMSVFNGEKTLGVAIRSILNQTYRNWELIVIDDGSTDDSLNIAKSFSDPRIKVLSDGLNKNLAARLNEAIENSNGDYFARMDQDDISFPERLSKQVRFMRENPDIDLVGAGVVIFKDSGELQGEIPVKVNHHDICHRPWNGFHLAHPTWLGRRKWFEANQYRSAADRAEDQDLLFRTYKASKFSCLTDVLLGYRQESRPFKKVLLARLVVLENFTLEAFRQKDLYILAMVLFVNMAKITADILYKIFKYKALRYKVDPVSESVSEDWKVLMDDIAGPQSA